MNVVEMGRVSYATAERIQAEHAASGRSTLLLGEPAPVYTRGPLARRVVKPEVGVPVLDVSRGGGMSYHGPGQLMGLLVVPYTPETTRRIENALIAAISDEGVTGEPLDRYPGVWVEGRKIASVGFRAHDGMIVGGGFALNVTVDLSAFDAIVPCGIDGVQMTSLAAETGKESFPELSFRVAARLTDELQEEAQGEGRGAG